MKIAIVTGASSGLGREIVRQMEAVFPEIEQYWLIARRQNRLKELAASLPEGRAECLPLDLCDPMSFITLQEKLAAVTKGVEGYQILLAHRPETLAQYAQAGIDLAFCGHAHGGQFRLPWGGVIAPNQGFFPKITAGIYRQDGTQMVVSRGLGNSWIPIRLFNRPEVLLVTLRRAKTPVSEKK